MPRFLKIRSLTVQFFLGIITVVVLPLSIIIFMVGSGVQSQYLSVSQESVGRTNELLGEKIDRYHATLLQDVKYLSKSAEKLLRISSVSDQSTIKQSMKAFVTTHAYDNVFVADGGGQIIYSARVDQLSGKNIYDKSVADSSLALTASAAMTMKTIVHSGSVTNPADPMNNTDIMVRPLMDNEDNILGFLALEIGYGHGIPAILDSIHPDISHTQAIIINAVSHVVYSSGAFTNHASFLSSTPYLSWKQQRNATDASTQTAIYPDINGVKVFGAYRPVTIAGFKLLLITEMPVSRMLAPLSDSVDIYIIMLLIIFLLILLLSFLMSQQIRVPIKIITAWLQQIADGERVNCYGLSQNSDIETLCQSVITLNNSYTAQRTFQKQKNWLEHRLSGLYEKMNGLMDLKELCNNITNYLARHINAPAAAMYLMDHNANSVLMGKYGCPEKGGFLTLINTEEGSLIHEATISNKPIALNNVSETFFRMETAHLDKKPDSVYVMPFNYGSLAKGVMVFALIKGIKAQHEKFLKDAAAPIASAVHSLELTLAKTEKE